MQLNSIILALLSIGIILSCSKEQMEDPPPTSTGSYYTAEEIAILQTSLNLPSTPYPYTYTLPSHLGNNSQPIEINRDKATLGRVLFYDPTLSENISVSCASCHQTDFAFGDEQKTSVGVFNRRTKRNTYSLANYTVFPSAYNSNSTTYFWDGRAKSIEEVIEESITNPSQLGITIEDYLGRILQRPYYEVLYQKAFPDEDLNKENIIDAMASFLSSMHSINSPFDEALEDIQAMPDYDFTQSLPDLSISENAGKNLFALHCANCHRASLFNEEVTAYANNGLDLEYEDQGVYEYTNEVQDQGLFRIPSLRNIVYTAPYMHDGRFNTLEKVINFYSTDVQNHFNLDQRLKTPEGQVKQLHLTASEKEDLITFLNTLTDDSSLTEKRYSNPFN